MTSTLVSVVSNDTTATVLVASTDGATGIIIMLWWCVEGSCDWIGRNNPEAIHGWPCHSLRNPRRHLTSEFSDPDAGGVRSVAGKLGLDSTRDDSTRGQAGSIGLGA
ncbi:hypothetical protein BDV59DRAFT_181266 [Aspergillus ambiguus]|uniref:uncharacterized protein n=1 Tax=Aspergillus ambiguus TaxID=176160 RepID=UPI003CCE513F